MATSNIATKSVLALGRKVLASWDAHPELFTGTEITRDAFAAKVAGGETIHTEAQTLRAAHKLQRKQRDAAVNTQIAALRQKEKEESAALDVTLTAKLDAEMTVIHEISRLANGLRYTAKAKALSDADEGNDLAAKAL